MLKMTLEDISVNFKKVKALRHVSYELKPGITALLGPNGAGKSTLMNVICTLRKPSTGKVYYNGVDITKQKREYLSKVSVQFQNQPMFKNDTAMDYLFFCGALKGLGREEIQKQGQELLQWFGIANTGKKVISAFSGGMRQRLALAGTFLGDPEIILLDEPSAGLDIYEREELKRYLCELKKDRIIIVSTHIVSDVEDIADDIVLLSNGRIYANGSQEELIRNLQGKIWELPEDRDVQLPTYYSNGKRLCCSDEMPISGAIQKTPDLTDAYFSCVKKR